MKHTQLIATLCVGLLLVVPSFAQEARSVLIVSIDALHPDALGAKTSPTLHALMRPGQYTLAGRSVDPPKTLIAHTAMLTGLSPSENGKQDNEWQTGLMRVEKPTLFNDAKRLGYRTAFYYAKPKLGYLVSEAVDEHALARDDGIDMARAFFRQKGRRLVFLHVSGLEDAGADTGWLSLEYLDELADIDKALAPLLAEVSQRGAYTIIVTSDHAGHDRQHGTQHPEDFKLPLIVASNFSSMPILPSGAWEITGLRKLVRSMLVTGQAQ
jgi:predicted AlkP superfamily pyrophosphatase or phosphodiesterase